MYEVKIFLIVSCAITYMLNRYLAVEIDKIVNGDKRYDEVFDSGVINYKKLYDYMKKDVVVNKKLKYFFWMHEINFIVMLVIFIIGVVVLVGSNL